MPRKNGKSRSRRRYRRKKNDKFSVPRPLQNGYCKVALKKHVTHTCDQDFESTASSLSLNTFSGYAAFTAMYEQYRIIGIKQTIVPMTQPGLSPMLSTGDNNQTITNAVYKPELIFHVDRDDLTLYSSFNNAMTNPKAKVRWLDRKVVIKFIPNILGNTFGALADNNMVIYDKWLDTEDSSDSVYYGLVKGYHCIGATSTKPFVVRVVTEAIVEFKGYNINE